MLVPVPYKVPKKTAEKEAKKTRGGFVVAALQTQYPKALMPIPPPKRMKRRRKMNPLWGKKEEDGLHTLGG